MIYIRFNQWPTDNGHGRKIFAYLPILPANAVTNPMETEFFLKILHISMLKFRKLSDE